MEKVSGTLRQVHLVDPILIIRFNAYLFSPLQHILYLQELRNRNQSAHISRFEKPVSLLRRFIGLFCISDLILALPDLPTGNLFLAS